jgi:hypothetical protein
MTLSIHDIVYSTTKLYHYAECHVLFVVMLSVIMLSVVILSAMMVIVVMLNVTVLSVVAPCINDCHSHRQTS